MSQYAKQQEDRMERKLINAGFKLVEDTARRKKNFGDRIMEHNDTGLTLVVDHKSTRNREGIKIEKKQLEKIAKEAKSYGYGLPVITFSYLDTREVYAVFRISDLKGVLS